MINIPRMLGGRYEVGELIGRGGMAQVHLGYDTRLSRTVAIKILRSDLITDQTFVARFRREAQSAAGLNHPSIVAVYDTGEERVPNDTGQDISLPYIVMEYVKGRTVSELLKNGDALPINEAVQISIGILSALEYSHREGIVHRDIKPGNIMLTHDGKVKVMDFGIARALTDSSATMTQTNSVVGTAQYLSPEQARGEVVDSRSDLYSAGCLLYELLTGRPPFRGDSAVAVAYQHVSEMPPSPMTIAPDIPEMLDRVVMKSLAKKREDRYQRAIDMRADLLSALRGGHVSAPASATWGTQILSAQQQPAPATTAIPQTTTTQTGVTPAVAPSKNNNAIYIILGILLLVVASVGLAWALLSSNNSPTPTEPTTVAVPDLDGTNQVSARQRLEEVGLTFVLGEPQEDKDIPEGKFVSSDPAFGTKVKVGSAVTVSFSSGPGKITVPDFTTGKYNQDAAKRELEKLGLKVGRVDIKDVPGNARDIVTDTSPAAGQQVERGASINIVVASGYIVFDGADITTHVIGQSREVAEAYLTDTLKIPSVTVVTSENPQFPEGTVFNMEPQAGTVPYDTKVTLWVAKKPSQPVLPPSNPDPPSDNSTGNGDDTENPNSGSNTGTRPNNPSNPGDSNQPGRSNP
ncbi:Stk1 family PASTA domain-containing Ser/Thr kinase [Arcanobacterium pinnipediorum]|uniref:non-specific serine/threonine protein kinase n=1 Tax=Arcanobacterium pinnipediorum TaxID=1503041 RepID=A0ABY5AHJ6_9ACTO|nr:Stk1 family PASTA domain-containing Ser/Thr kinase [Arcanobacterium pinnipediorum]USR79480.1 Stk1 family PASTA domain-containing Ser/Thr kinase [Arcanobacterium pinnipediorum]